MPDNAATMRTANSEQRTANSEQRTANSEQPDLSPLFSIILPVYNCGKYLPKCLDSLINQDYPTKNYEIIITDDGSTDGSGKICDEYAAKFPFIHVTHTENGGPSHARNVALPQCKGEYIAFCDGDDFVSPQMISVLTQAVEVYSAYDIIIYRHYREPYHKNFFTGTVQSLIKRHFVNMPQEGWPVYDVHKMNETEGEFMNGEEFCVNAINSLYVGGFLWNKLIKKTLLKNINFDETLPASEDTNFCVKIAASHRDLKTVRINYYLYCYVRYAGGTGQSHDNSRLYDKQGMSSFLAAEEKNLAETENIYPEAAKEIRYSLYVNAADLLYIRRKSGMSREVFMKAKQYTGVNYAFGFYFRSKRSFMLKCRTLIRHLISLVSPRKILQ